MRILETCLEAGLEAEAVAQPEIIAGGEGDASGEGAGKPHTITADNSSRRAALSFRAFAPI
jgi:hypothetical protein